MASPTVGFATLQIVPSVRGIESGIAGSIAGPLAVASAKAGDDAAKGFSSKFVAGAAAAGALAAGALSVGIAGFVGLAAIGSQFDEAFDAIRTGTGQTGVALDGLKQSFKDVVASVPTDFGSAGQAITELNQRLGLTGQPLEDLSAQLLELSRITGTDLSANIESVAQLFNNFGVAAGDQGGKLDLLFRASQQTGVSVADLASAMQQSGVVLRQVGFDFDQSATFIAGLAKAGISAGDVMPALSKSLATAAKAGLDAQTVFAQTFDAIRNAPSDTAAAATAMEVFGAKAGPKLAAAIREGKLSLDDLSKSIVGGSDTILAAGKDTQDFGEKFELLKNRVFVGLEPLASGAFDAIGKGMDALGPILGDVTAGVSAFAAAFTDGGDDITSSGLAGVLEQIAVVARNVFDAIVEQGPRVGEILSGAFTAVVNALRPVISALQEALPPIIALAKDGFEVIAAVVVGVLLPALQVVLPILGEIAAAVIQFAGFLAENREVLAAFALVVATLAAPMIAFKVAMLGIGAASKVVSIVSALQKGFVALNATMLLNPAVLIAAAIVALGAAIFLAYQKFEPFRNVVDAVGRALRTAFEWLISSNIGNVLLVLFTPFLGIPLLIIKNWSTLVDFFTGLVEQVVGVFQTLVESPVFQVIIDVVRNTFDNVMQVIQGALDVVIGIFNFFKALFTGDWEGMWAAILQIVSGVWAMISAVIQQAINVVTGILRAGFEIAKSVVTGAIEAIAAAFAALPGIILGFASAVGLAAIAIGAAIMNGIKAGVTAIAGLAGDIASGVVTVVKNAWNEIARQINEFVPNSIGFGPFSLDLPDNPIPTFATGGIVPGPVGKPVFAIVHGGEEVIPVNGAGRDDGGVSYSSVINIAGNVDGDVYRQMRRDERSKQQRATALLAGAR